MTSFDLTLFRHSAVRLERDGKRLAVDPGGFSDMAVLEGADAVLITHEHPDHVNTDAVVEALTSDEQLEVWAPTSVVESLTRAGAPADRVHEPADGQEFSAAGFRVKPTVTDHALIHQDIPIVTNIAYLIEGRVLHPGDSLTVVPPAADLDGGNLEVLLLPISAPWGRIADVIDYARAIAPATIVPIHDAILSKQGVGVFDNVAKGQGPKDAEYRRLAAGETLTVGV